MVDKINKLGLPFFALLSSLILFSDDIDQSLSYKETTNKTSINSSLQESNDINQSNKTILLDSIVVLNKTREFNNVSGIKTIGSFVYEVKPGNLKQRFVSEIIQDQSGSSKSFDTGYRLVEILGKNNLITDGSFVVTFKNPEDKDQLTLDYGLLPKYDMPKSISYKSKDFSNLQSLINTIKSDERVESVELDLIDPYIVLQ